MTQQLYCDGMDKNNKNLIAIINELQYIHIIGFEKVCEMGPGLQAPGGTRITWISDSVTLQKENCTTLLFQM